MSPKGTAYVTGKLHRIGGQLAEANARRGQDPSAQPEQGAEAAQAEPGAVQAPPLETAKRPQPRSQEAEKALQQRHEEFNRLRRDVATRIAEQLAILPEEINSLQARADAIVAAEEKLKELAATVEALEDPSANEQDFSKNLAVSFKTLENSRLEMIMAMAKLEKAGEAAKSSQHSGHAQSASILPELNSLGFRQLFKFGLYLTIPVAGAIVLGGLIIAIAIFAAMRLGL